MLFPKLPLHNTRVFPMPSFTEKGMESWQFMSYDDQLLFPHPCRIPSLICCNLADSFTEMPGLMDGWMDGCRDGLMDHPHSSPHLTDHYRSPHICHAFISIYFSCFSPLKKIPQVPCAAPFNQKLATLNFRPYFIFTYFHTWRTPIPIPVGMARTAEN